MCDGHAPGSAFGADRNRHSGVFLYRAGCRNSDGRLGCTTIEASVFADLLEPLGDAKLEGTYTSDYYSGSGALVCNSYGKGKAYYYGSAWNEMSAEIFLQKLGAANPYRDIVTVPEECEIAVRSKNGVRYLFVLNYESIQVEITLHRKGTDLYTGNEIEGSQTLDGYGTMVIRL